MTSTEYNIVLTYCKIHMYLKIPVTNFDVVPYSESGTLEII